MCYLGGFCLYNPPVMKVQSLWPMMETINMDSIQGTTEQKTDRVIHILPFQEACGILRISGALPAGEHGEYSP